MKKKAVFAVLAAVVMLTACKDRTGREVSIKETSAEQESGTGEEVKQEEIKEPETEQQEKKESAAEPEKIAETEPEKDEEEADSEDEFVKGIISDTGWESEYLDMRYTMPEGMYMATEEELNELMGLGAEALSEDFSESQLKYAQMRTEYEMMSVDATGDTNVVITVEKLPISSLDAKAYVQSLKIQLGQITTIPYIVSDDDETVSVAGKDYIRVSTQIGSGEDARKQDYYVYVVQGRAVCLVITYLDETLEQVEAVLNAFTTYSSGQ